MFGQQQRLKTPLAVNAGSRIMITSSGGNEAVVSKFAVDEADQKRVVSTQVDSVIRAVVELGGTYPDVVQALQELEADGALGGRFEVNTVPEAGRTYKRVAMEKSAAPDHQADGEGGDSLGSGSPRDGGAKHADRRGQSGGETEKTSAFRPDSGKKPHPFRSFLARMTGRKSD